MLIGFKFENFRSFLAEQSFSFSTSSDRTHEATHLMPTGMKAVPKISRVAIAFGPNASGKTNLLIALATFRDLVLHSTAYSDSQFSERHTPFKFGPSATQATRFEIDVLLGHVRYRYAMSYDAERIRSERLLVYRTGKSQRWFDRHYDAVAERDAWAPFSPNFNGPREMWRKATRPKALFLTTAAQLNSELLAPLLDWIEHRLEVLFPADMSDVNRIATRIQDASIKARIIGLLRAVGIPVDDVRVAEQNQVPAGPVAPTPGVPAIGTPAIGAPLYSSPGGTRRSIEFLHAREGWLPSWLDSVFEAAGTRRLIGLFGPLLQAIEGGKVLLIDEFDAGLHPLVARYLIQLINDPRASENGAQLLLTSHNITLMDLDILRRDEIWLVEPDEKHASTLLPLLRSSPRKHELIAKNYLRGRYGAVPVIRTEARGA